jgi:predicted RNA binding protein YcfA (HicA-like mRNA interferase family)
VNRNAFIKILAEKGVFFDHHGSRHDIFIHQATGKKIPIPRHSEMKNKFLKRILDEIPRK